MAVCRLYGRNRSRYISTHYFGINLEGLGKKNTKKKQPGTLLSPLSRVLVSIRITVLWKVRPYSNVEFCQPLSYIYPEKQYLCST